MKYNILIHFSPMLHFYTPWKRQKTIGFLTFSGGIEMWHWTKRVKQSRTNWFCFIIAQIPFSNQITLFFHPKYLLKKLVVGHFGFWRAHEHETVVLVKPVFFFSFIYIWQQKYFYKIFKKIDGKFFKIFTIFSWS